MALSYILEKPSKKEVLHFLHLGGQDRSLLHFFFPKILSKLALHCTLKAFFFGFSLHFPENRGGGSDPSVTNVTLFLIKASLREALKKKLRNFEHCPNHGWRSEKAPTFEKLERRTILF